MLRKTNLKLKKCLSKQKKTFRDWMGSLADHPISKKYTSVEIVELASKMRAEKEKKKWGVI